MKEKHARRILSLGSQNNTEEFGMWEYHPLLLEPQEIWEKIIYAELGWGLASHRFIQQ